MRGAYATQDSTEIVGSELNAEVLKAESSAGAYGSNGQYGSEAKASSFVGEGDLELNIGDEDYYQITSKVSGEFLKAETRGNGILYTGGKERRYGANLGAGAEAHVAKVDIEGGANNPLYESSVKAGASIGSVGAAGDLEAYVDTDDHYGKLKIAGKLAALVGLKVDIDIKLKWGWAVNIINDAYKDKPKTVKLGGTILSGTNKVLIGN